MIKSVTVTNHLGDSIRLGLTDPEKSGFVIKSIDGLGPVKADINLTELSNSDGGLFNSSRLNTRNITMTLKFLENPTIEATRLLSYKYFQVKQNITLIIETDERKCKISGRVESNEPDIFSDDEGCNISILCPDPFLYSINDEHHIIYGTEPAFEFPFSNESLSDPLLAFGYIDYRTTILINYSGDSDAGIIITIHALDDNITGLIIYNYTTKKELKIDDDKLESLTGSKLKQGDDIIINTLLNNRSVTLLRDGIYTNILNTVIRPYNWFQLSKGDNIFVVASDSDTSYLRFDISNSILYGGV
jgi:hypothetical protein